MGTFKEACDSYIKQGGGGKYLNKLIEVLGERDVTTITPAEIRVLSVDLYPEHQNSTRNRQVLTPVRSVLYHAHDLGWRSPIRIRKLRTVKSTKHSPVSDKWLSSFLAQADEDNLFHLSALVVFMNHTAARVSEAVELKWENIDFKKRIAILERTKTDRNALAYLTDELMYRLYNLDKDKEKPVFKYTSRYSVNERISSVCKRAGIEYKPSHSIGRYSFATNALKLGLDVKTAMDAGRWKSSAIFLETYVTPEHAGRSVADAFNKQRYSQM